MEVLTAGPSPAQQAVRTIAAVVFLVAGVAHFVALGMLARFIPPWLPTPEALVLVSGVLEIAGGAGLLLPRFRRFAGLGLAMLLVLILPANIFMATHPDEAGLAGVPVVVFWTRIALLPVMIWVLLWCSRGRRAS